MSTNWSSYSIAPLHILLILPHYVFADNGILWCLDCYQWNLFIDSSKEASIKTWKNQLATQTAFIWTASKCSALNVQSGHVIYCYIVCPKIMNWVSFDIENLTTDATMNTKDVQSNYIFVRNRTLTLQWASLHTVIVIVMHAILLLQFLSETISVI